MVQSESATLIYKYFVLLIFLIMILLAYIVTNSLIETSIEQRQYENAMLRILGWNNKYIILVTVIKSTLFNIIPGAILGLAIASTITS
jgi:ABC-type lipoprotein release transport system permease subunit